MLNSKLSIESQTSPLFLPFKFPEVATTLYVYSNKLVYSLYTAFLFTKSDIKTTVIPITLFAVAAAPLQEFRLALHVVFWTWLHVLQFDVSNQTLQPEEDAMNKKDRPLPSRRLSLQSALVLRWLLIPACWYLSILYSIETLASSIALVTLTLIYNELSGHRGHWIVRNTINAAGFASFEAGATLVAVSGHTRIDTVGILSIIISAGIFATSIHAQDFKDGDGDRAVGRRTIPIVFSPSVARYTVIVPLLGWSIFLSWLWALHFITSLAFISLGLFVGIRFLRRRTIHDDQISFYWYNIWLSLAHVLPGYYRFYSL